jgi:hypothetical protein
VLSFVSARQLRFPAAAFPVLVLFFVFGRDSDLNLSCPAITIGTGIKPFQHRACIAARFRHKEGKQ